jgi:hypothetical protein
MTSKLGSIFPEPVPPRDDVAESVQEEVLESRPGETDFDRVVRAETLAPQVIAAITRLQNALWFAATELARRDPGNPAVQQAREALKGVLEVFLK